MSFSNKPSSPPHCMPMSLASSDVGGVQPHSPINHDQFESYCQLEHAPPLNRITDTDNNLPNCTTFPANKSKVNSPNLLKSKGTRHIFYKTRMCDKFLKQTCKSGKNCRFAHGVEDLREPPPNWKDLVRANDTELNKDQGQMYRLKICKMFYDEEECPYGDKCRFVHERSPKFKTNMSRNKESSAMSIETTGNLSDPSLVETSKHENDHFAHDQSELQPPNTPRPFSIALSANTVVNASIKEEKVEKKILKWKPSKKIVEIYGDWLDGYVPPHLIFSNTES